MGRCRHHAWITTLGLGLLATWPEIGPRETVSGFLIASAQAQTTGDQPTAGSPRYGGRVNLIDRSGSRLIAVLSIDGQYIPEVLTEVTWFFSEIAGSEVQISPTILDGLEAIRVALGIDFLVVESISVPDAHGRPINIAVSTPGRDLTQFCRALFALRRGEAAQFCTAETASPANPVLIGSYPELYAISWQDGSRPPEAELLAALEQPVPSPAGGMSLEFVRHNMGDQQQESPGHVRAPLGCTHRLSGPILSGDGARLASALGEMAERLDRARERGVQLGRMVLCLQSPGGSLREGLRIATAILQAGLPTRVEADAHCLSACFWVFMAGNSRAFDGTRQPDRVLSPGGHLGFHAPMLDVSIREATAGELAAALQLGIQAVALISTTFSEHGGFSDGRPILMPSLLTEMLITPPETIRGIDTVEDVGLWNIQLDLPHPGPQPERAFLQACANRIAWRRDERRGSYLGLYAEAREDRVDIRHRRDNTVVCSFRATDVEIQAGRPQVAVPTGLREIPVLFASPQTLIRDLTRE